MKDGSDYERIAVSIAQWATVVPPAHEMVASAETWSETAEKPSSKRWMIWVEVQRSASDS